MRFLGGCAFSLLSSSFVSPPPSFSLFHSVPSGIGSVPSSSVCPSSYSSSFMISFFFRGGGPLFFTISFFPSVVSVFPSVSMPSAPFLQPVPHHMIASIANSFSPSHIASSSSAPVPTQSHFPSFVCVPSVSPVFDPLLSTLAGSVDFGCDRSSFPPCDSSPVLAVLESDSQSSSLFQ